VTVGGGGLKREKAKAGGKDVDLPLRSNSRAHRPCSLRPVPDVTQKGGGEKGAGPFKKLACRRRLQKRAEGVGGRRGGRGAREFLDSSRPSRGREKGGRGKGKKKKEVLTRLNRPRAPSIARCNREKKEALAVRTHAMNVAEGRKKGEERKELTASAEICRCLLVNLLRNWGGEEKKRKLSSSGNPAPSSVQVVNHHSPSATEREKRRRGAGRVEFL